MMAELTIFWLLSLHTMVISAETGGAVRPGGAPDVSTSSTTQGEIEAIDQFCNGLSPMTKEKERRRLFGLFQKDERDKGRWIEYKRERNLDAAVKEERVFDVAQVWSREDGATAVSMSFSSGSGDWAHFVEYCFRTDGTLARVNSTLNTFNAVDKDPEKDVEGASRQRDRYFDVSGKQIKVARRVLDLKTKRPAPSLQVMDAKEPIYKTVVSLPFHSLLKVNVAAQQGIAPDGRPPAAPARR